MAQPREIVARGGVLRATLTAAQRRVDVAGKPTLAKTYAPGSFLGPTLVVHPGDRIDLTLRNRLHEETNLHFHGLDVSPAASGDNIFVSVKPGGAHRYAFTVPRDAPAGTYWYHSHAMAMGMGGAMTMRSEEQVFDGLSGVLEVRGAPGPLDELPQRVLALKDVQVRRGAIVTHDIDSGAPTTRTVNGQLRPRLTLAPGQRQLWRVANVGADIFYALHLDGHRLTVVGEDGRPVERPWRAGTLVLPPGKRFDVVVTGGRAGTTTSLRTLAFDQGEDHYPDRVLATLTTTGARTTTTPLPATIARTPDLARRHVTRHRTIVFGENAAGDRFLIDGKAYDPDRIDVHAKLGTVEEWTIANHTEELHPFHLHTYPLQVMSVNGVPHPFDGDQDEVVLPAQGYVTVRVAFRRYTGLTVLHCHILAHEDAGMMANVLVRR